MVRLKGNWSARNDNDEEMFQFHNGSIKSFGASSLNIVSSSFQFHNGSIKREFAVINTKNETVFQFHNGSIKSYAVFTDGRSEDDVSIPQWFD